MTEKPLQYITPTEEMLLESRSRLVELRDMLPDAGDNVSPEHEANLDRSITDIDSYFEGQREESGADKEVVNTAPKETVNFSV